MSDLERAKAGEKNLEGAYLEGADLRRANLKEADLCRADLRGANLWGADLREAYLKEADLGGADLRGADLRGADLWGASLRGADLEGACFNRAHINWQSHDLIAEILRQAAGSNISRRGVAGIILLSPELCWKDFLQLEHCEKAWAVETLMNFPAANPLAEQGLLEAKRQHP